MALDLMKKLSISKRANIRVQHIEEHEIGFSFT